MINRKKILRKLSHFYVKHILRDTFTREVDRWFNDRGDQNLRLDYALDEGSIVFDIGGYVGDFAADIHAKTGCKVFLFEPSQEHYAQCLQRFKGSPEVQCFSFGLGSSEKIGYLGDAADASSVSNVPFAENDERISLRRFSDVCSELGVKRINLMKINIEGGEYDLLPHLIETGIVAAVENIQIQFHNFVDGAVVKRAAIVEALAKTHERTWCYEFVWENWTLKCD